MLVAPVLLVFYRVSEPFVFMIERTSSMISKLMGLRGETHGGGHSAEELKFIVSTSRDQGHLHHFEEDAIQHLLDLQNYSAREIMVPRNDIVSVSVDAPLDQVLRLLIDHQYSRLPVYERKPENIIGVVHYKDLTRVWEERRQATERRRPVMPFRLRRLIRKPMVVPETKPLNQLVDEFRQNRNHMAIVVDEFGTIVGMVTLEDVLEQVFGEIGDEHDESREAPSTEAKMLDLEAIPVSEIWKLNMELSCRAMLDLRRWQDFCSSNLAKFLRLAICGARSPALHHPRNGPQPNRAGSYRETEFD